MTEDQTGSVTTELHIKKTDQHVTET